MGRVEDDIRRALPDEPAGGEGGAARGARASPRHAAHRSPRRKWQRVVLFVVASTAVVVVAGAVLVSLVSHSLNTPAQVPKSWRAPAVLPASGPPMPAGNLVFDSDQTGNYEIWTMNAEGGDQRQLTNDRDYDSWSAQLSPDRRTILFYRTPRGTHDRDFSKTSLWAMAADGSDPVELRPAGLDGWVFQGHAEWSPDGRQLVMFGGSRSAPQIWITNDLGGDPTAMTHRDGANIDPSWAPNGRMIAFVGCPSSDCQPHAQEIYLVPASGGAATRITDDNLQDDDPTFAPNGRELAWVTRVGGTGVGNWNIRLLPVTVAGETVVVPQGAHPAVVVKHNGGAIDSNPVWSTNGTTIYFQRAIGGLQNGFQIWGVEPSGADLREFATDEAGSNEYPST